MTAPCSPLLTDSTQSLTVTGETSVVDPKLFIPETDPALNFPSSGSRQKFRSHVDPDPTFINKVSIIRNNKKTLLKFNQLQYLPFSIQYFCPIVQTVQN